jgi:hypothetical protein
MANSKFLVVVALTVLALFGLKAALQSVAACPETGHAATTRRKLIAPHGRCVPGCSVLVGCDKLAATNGFLGSGPNLGEIRACGREDRQQFERGSKRRNTGRGERQPGPIKVFACEARLGHDCVPL